MGVTRCVVGVAIRVTWLRWSRLHAEQDNILLACVQDMPLPKKLSSHSLSCENKVVAKRYLVQRRLGSGSFGTVYLVTDTNVNDEK